MIGNILAIMILGLIVIYLGIQSLLCILLSAFTAVVLCHIDVETSYAWYYGLWHGLFFVPKFLLYLVADSPFKAEICSTAYNIIYWIFSVLSTITIFKYLYIGRRPD